MYCLVQREDHGNWLVVVSVHSAILYSAMLDYPDLRLFPISS